MNVYKIQYCSLKSKYCPESEPAWRRFVLSECFLLLLNPLFKQAVLLRSTSLFEKTDLCTKNIYRN